MHKDICSILPHQPPMLLLDKCEKISDTQSLGHYAVRGDEFFLQGHFPDEPIVPGVILCEMMAQCSHIVLPLGKAYLAKMDNIKFRRPVVPGDTVTLKSKLIKKAGGFFTFEAEAYADGQLAASGEITLVSRK